MHLPARAPVRFKTDPTARRPGQLSLFPNDIPEGRFGIVAPFADRFKRLTDDITEESARADYEASSRAGRGLIFRGQERNDWALQHTGEGIDGPAQAYREIERLRSPAVVKGVLTLWNSANERGTFEFRGTRLSHIMRAGGYAPTSTGQYTQAQKREFTSTLYALERWRFYIDRDVRDTDDDGREQDMVERRFFSILAIERALHAKRRDGTADESVIVRLWGELLPRLNKALERGRSYPKTLLRLDAGRDGAALLLGFKLSTRIDQLRQSDRAEPLTLSYELGELVKLAGRTKDYPKLIERQRRYKIRQALARDLKKLVEIGCIGGYEPERLPLDDLDRVTILAPKLSLPAPEPEPVPEGADTGPSGAAEASRSEVTADTGPAEGSRSEVTDGTEGTETSRSEATTSRPEVTIGSPEVTPDEPEY